MRVFVGEFLCGGGMMSTPCDRIPSSLLSEGRAMWQALLADFAAWAEVVTPIDPRLDLSVDRMPETVRCILLRPAENVRDQWLEVAKTCDVAMVVAPETDGELAQMIQHLRDARIDVLAADETTLRMATDKWITAKWLAGNAIPSPRTWSKQCEHTDDVRHRSNGVGSIGLHAKRWVRKPRDGCGSDSIRVFDDLESACSDITNNELVQAWIEGRPASILMIGSATNGVAKQIVCPAVWQHFRWQPEDSDPAERLGICETHYTGGSGPIDANLISRVLSLAEQVTKAFPEPPHGFLGIDVVLGDRAEDDCVIEINPRLTTSYIGVRQMTDENLTSIWDPSASAERLIASGPFRSGVNQVRWTHDGEVRTKPSKGNDF